MFEFSKCFYMYYFPYCDPSHSLPNPASVTSVNRYAKSRFREITCTEACIDLRKSERTESVAFTGRAFIYDAAKIRVQAFAGMGQVSIVELTFLRVYPGARAAEISIGVRPWAGRWCGISWSNSISVHFWHLKPHRVSPPPLSGLQPNTKVLNIHGQQCTLVCDDSARSYPGPWRCRAQRPRWRGWGVQYPGVVHDRLLESSKVWRENLDSPGLNSSLFSHSLSVLLCHLFICLFIYFVFLDSTYKWNHMVFVFLGYFT